MGSCSIELVTRADPDAEDATRLTHVGLEQLNWAAALRDRTTDARIILFGSHTDLQARAVARAAGLGPM